MQRGPGIATFSITHDIGIACEIADRVAIMYAGSLVVTGPVGRLIDAPAHPYSIGLLHSTVHDSSRGRELPSIPGGPPDLAHMPPGCRSNPRCNRGTAQCLGAMPPPGFVVPDRQVACYHPQPKSTPA